MKHRNLITETLNTLDNETKALNHIKLLYGQMLSADAQNDRSRKKLAKELLALQKEDGSFRVIDDYRCDGDIQVEYVYFPTYYATAALIFAANSDGMNETLRSALKKGLAFASGRELAGHGYDAVSSQIEALSIYKKAGLYKWMAANEREYPQFGSLLRRIIGSYRERLSQGQTSGAWGTDFAEAFEREVDDYEAEMCTKVWYAAYGSNINQERFMRYVYRCEDTALPEKVRPVILPYDIYFAYRSSKWNKKAVAFLDDSKRGRSFGRMYLITREQFDSVHGLEGSIYKKKLFLGMEDGIPIYTFTSPEKRTDPGAPGIDYIETILSGLKEAYPERTELLLSAYLFGCGVLNEDDRRILSYIRESEHGVSLENISGNVMAITRARASVRKLLTYNMIRQDRRSIAAGYSQTDRKAVFYTRKNSRELIDFFLLSVR